MKSDVFSQCWSDVWRLALTLAILLPGLGWTVEPNTPAAPLRILWLGSSSTYFNDLPGQFGEWAERALERKVETEVVGKDATLIHLYLEPDFKANYGLRPGETVLGKIADGRFDLVVLQVAIDYLGGRNGGDPDMIGKGLTIYLDAVVRAGAVPVLYEQAWDRNRPEVTEPQADQGAKIYLATGAACSTAVLAPCRSAWKMAQILRPDLNLNENPNSRDKGMVHPGLLGTYLNLCVFYAAILDRSPVGLPARMRHVAFGPPGISSRVRPLPEGAIDPAVAQVLQESAWSAVQSTRKKTAELRASAPNNPPGESAP